MKMKAHILTALREQFNHWEELLLSMNEEQLTGWHVLPDWSTKAVMAHLWAWQQISIARLEAARGDREPEYPSWVANLPEDWEEHTDQTNAWVFETYHPVPWPTVYRNWREGYLHFLELGEAISEVNLLDSDKYSWLDGRPLAVILLASYDHHQEHFEKLLGWLQEHGY